MSSALYDDGFSLYFIDNGPIYTHPSYSLADLAHFLNPLKNCSLNLLKCSDFSPFDMTVIVSICGIPGFGPGQVGILE